MKIVNILKDMEKIYFRVRKTVKIVIIFEIFSKIMG